MSFNDFRSEMFRLSLSFPKLECLHTASSAEDKVIYAQGAGEPFFAEFWPFLMDLEIKFALPALAWFCAPMDKIIF